MTNTVAPNNPTRYTQQFPELTPANTITAANPSSDSPISRDVNGANYNQNSNEITRTVYNDTPGVDTSIYGTNTDWLSDPKLGVMPDGTSPPTDTQTYRKRLEKFGL